MFDSSTFKCLAELLWYSIEHVLELELRKAIDHLLIKSERRWIDIIGDPPYQTD